MFQISNKLQELRSNIRKQQLKEIMQREREDVQRQNDEALLREIAEASPNDLTPFQLQTLLQLVNKDTSNALITLGNLVIDRFIGTAELQQVQWQVGNSEHWPWLIHAFAEVGFCTGEMFELCIKRIKAKRSGFSLEHALEVLLKSFKLSEQALNYLRHSPELVLALSNHVFEGDERIPQLSLIIFSSLTSDHEDLPHYFLQCLGEGRTAEMLIVGLMKVQSVPRALACQVANNFLLSGIWLERVHRKLLEQASREKQRMKVEISYYLKAFVETVPETVILSSIKQHRLLEVLHKYSQAITAHPKLGREIADNAVSSIATIRQRFNDSTNPERDCCKQLIHLQKLLYESESQTIYEDESMRMIE